MAINKVVYGGNTLIDITGTTATEADVKDGKAFYLANGVQGTGSLSFATYYTGSSVPSASLGEDGDIYLEVVS